MTGLKKHCFAERSRRLYLRLASIILGLYVGVIALLMAFENRMVFHPVTAAESWEPAPVANVSDVEWLVDGGKIHGWWCAVPHARYAVLFCHGNAGNLSHRGYAVPHWQGLGCSILLFDYPGYGRSDGAPSEAGCYQSAFAAWQWLV